MTDPIPKPGIMDVQPYVGGLHTVEGVDKVVVLASNEGPLGASPRAIEAYQKESGKLHLYPDGGAGELRAAIGERFGLDPARIVEGKADTAASKITNLRDVGITVAERIGDIPNLLKEKLSEI